MVLEVSTLNLLTYVIKHVFRLLPNTINARTQEMLIYSVSEQW